MPRRPPRLCSIPGCIQLTEGAYCPDHIRKRPEVLADRARLSPSKRGYGRRHERWRRSVIARDPLCKIGVICGGLAPSVEADHIVPLAAGGGWSLENGQGACKPCHSWKTATQDSQFAKSKKRGRMSDRVTTARASLLSPVASAHPPAADHGRAGPSDDVLSLARFRFY